jgi:hypothetical protein
MGGSKMTDVARETLAHTARDAEARIVRIETQLRAVAEALFALADPKKHNFDIALRAVKDSF